MIDLGTVKPGATIRIPWSSFDKDDGSSITMTNYAVADILIYKDGSTTERASTAGFAATTDFDSKTGKHLTVIDLADNTTAGFFAAGSEYLVAIDAVTVDAVTTGGWVARFYIGYTGAILDTTIATLSSQTSFTLTAGPAEDDALNGCWAVIHDVASAVQKSVVQILDYTGSTKTVTLAAGATFTAAATDNISVMGPMPLQPGTTGRTVGIESNGKVTGVVLTDTLTTYTGNTPQTGDAYAIVNSGTHGNSAIKTQTAAIEADTQDIQSRLPATLDGTNMRAKLADGVTHGGTSAMLRLGANGATPALYVTNDGVGAAANFTGGTGPGVLMTTSAGVGPGLNLRSFGGNALLAQEPVVFSETTTFSGAVSLGSTLTVSGATSLAALSMTTLTASGAVALQSTLAVTGTTTLTGAVSLGSTLTVTGATSLAALGMTTLTASGAVAFQSTVAVTGTTTLTGAVSLGSTLTVTGAATFSSTTDGTLGAIIADLEDGGRTDLLIDSLVADNPGRPTRGVQLDNFIFMMFDATDGFTPEPSITVTATISKDGGAFAACTNSVSEISAGFYKITLTATEMTADSIALKFTGTGCRQTNFTFRTQPT